LTDLFVSNEVNKLLELTRKKLILPKVKFLRWLNHPAVLEGEWEEEPGDRVNELLEEIFAFYPDILLTKKRGRKSI